VVFTLSLQASAPNWASKVEERAVGALRRALGVSASAAATSARFRR